MPTIELLEPKSFRKSYDLGKIKKDIIRIGRARDNDIQLPDRSLKVSRYHAAILRDGKDPERYVLRDLSSTWGTKIGRRTVYQKKLSNGDEVRIAQFRLRFSSASNGAAELFRPTDDSIDRFFAAIPHGIDEKSTVVFDFEKRFKRRFPRMSGETKMRVEEFLREAEEYTERDETLDNAIDLVFHVLGLSDDCVGSFVLFGGGRNLRVAVRKGDDGITNIALPMHIIEKLECGACLAFGNQLFVSLVASDDRSLGFLYINGGQSRSDFDNDELDIISLICGAVAGRVAETDSTVQRYLEFIEWPRLMTGSRKLLDELDRMAHSDSNVLILGETGVGKEVLAGEIHKNSKRSSHKFVTVNCAAIPENLLESELFGTRKGAFTGAIDKVGSFEIADNGTIFLDEIGDMSDKLQSKLLRVVQERSVKRVGGVDEKHVDVRIIAATNHDLEKEIEEGKFRSDLYYRFGDRITIPPLRLRKYDIPVMAHYFLDRLAEGQQRKSRGLTPQAMKCLLSHQWRGNVRELENAIGEAFSKSKGIIFIKHLPEAVKRSSIGEERDFGGKREPASRVETEKQHIKEVLAFTRGNKQRAKEILGISKQTLYSKIEKYGIPKDFGKVKE